MADSVIDREAGGSYRASEISDNIEKEIERLRGQTFWAWDKEARNLGWFGLQDGMSILDVGCGPGFVAEQLLMLYPNSIVTCVDVDADLLAHARQYLKSKGLDERSTVVKSDVMALDLPDNSIDFAYARFVFQHLRNPGSAMAEVRRVLKPGGKFVIHDIDTGLGEIYGPRDEKADAIEQKIHESQNKHGGNSQIGRELWRLMTANGFEKMDLEVVPVHTDKIGTAPLFPDEWDPGAYRLALERGVMTEGDLETMHSAHILTRASTEKYALFVSLMVCGRKSES